MVSLNIHLSKVYVWETPLLSTHKMHLAELLARCVKEGLNSSLKLPPFVMYTEKILFFLLWEQHYECRAVMPCCCFLNYSKRFIPAVSVAVSNGHNPFCPPPRLDDT